MIWETEVASISDQRMTASLRTVAAYWESLRGSVGLPIVEDFDLAVLPADILPWTLMTEHDHGGDAIIRFWGTERTRLFGRDYTNKSVQEIDPPLLRDKIVSEHMTVAAQRAPLFVHSMLPFSKNRNSSVLRYQALRLPLQKSDSLTLRVVSVVEVISGIGNLYELMGGDKPLNVLREELSPRVAGPD